MVEPQPVRLLGEVALCVNDLATMRAFYRDVVGLAVWREEATFVFCYDPSVRDPAGG